MSSIVVLGASSFIGQVLLNVQNLKVNIKAVARTRPHDDISWLDHVTWHSADLTKEGVLDEILEPNDLVINLIYMHNESAKNNELLLGHIINSCNKRKVSRLVHCSTAGVVGVTRDIIVSEVSKREPISRYEKTKCKLEDQLCTSSHQFDLAILRPTAVVGIGGSSLVKLVNDLLYSGAARKYLTACLFGSRPMYLVAVDDVVAALIHLIYLPEHQHNEVYILSSDDDSANNFSTVERILFRALGLKKRIFPVIPVPKSILSLLLRLRGRSHFNMRRRYSSQKLRSTGFKFTGTISDSVYAFGVSMRPFEQRSESRND
jgi:nucleoside-diphosphate-sugar epimerase